MYKTQIQILKLVTNMSRFNIILGDFDCIEAIFYMKRSLGVFILQVGFINRGGVFFQIRGRCLVNDRLTNELK